MNNPSWLVQICEMTDNDSRRWVGSLLERVHGLELAESGSGRILIVGCGSKSQALAVQRFVVTVDPTAVVINTRAPLEMINPVGATAS